MFDLGPCLSFWYLNFGVKIMAATLGLDSVSFLPKFADAQNIALDRDIIALRKQLQDLDSKALDHTDTISVLKEHVGRAEKDVVLASFKLSEASKAFANEEHLHQLDLRRLVRNSTRSMNPLYLILAEIVSYFNNNCYYYFLSAAFWTMTLHILCLVMAKIQSSQYPFCIISSKGRFCEMIQSLPSLYMRHCMNIAPIPRHPVMILGQALCMSLCVYRIWFFPQKRFS